MERGVAMSNGGVATEERTGLISRQDYKGGVAMQKRGVACPEIKRGYAEKGVVTQRGVVIEEKGRGSARTCA